MMNNVRITPEIGSGLHLWLVKEAKDKHRSVHGQVVHMLETHRKRAERKVVVIGHGSVTSIESIPPKRFGTSQ